MAATERNLRFGWVLPDRPNEFYKKTRLVEQCMDMIADGHFVDGARLVDLGSSYHGQYTLLGVWWRSMFYPTREYYSGILGILPRPDEPQYEKLVQEEIVGALL